MPAQGQREGELVMLGCGPGQPDASDTVLVKEHPEYRGTGEDLQEQEDRAVVGATAVGATGSAPFLATSALIAGSVTHAGGGSPAAAPAGETKPKH